MKQVLTLLVLLCATALAAAQVQFWNLADIEDGQWAPARISKKLQQLTLYRTDENGNKLDASNPNEVQQYNSNGQLTARTTYRYDWRAKKWNLLAIDTFIYNLAGKLIVYRGYEGPERNPVYETQVQYNAKGQQVRQDDYSLSGDGHKQESYELFEYDAKGLAKKDIMYNADKTVNSTRLFFFSAAGKLVKVSTTSFGSTTVDTYTWNDKGLLTGHKQMIGKDLQRTISYTYDDKNRRVKKQTITPTTYDDLTIYSYDGNSELPAKTSLEYAGPGGKSDRRHEYTEMEYGFLK